jgi:hypothetical protein
MIGRQSVLAGPAEHEPEVDTRGRLTRRIPGGTPSVDSSPVQVNGICPVAPGVKEPAEQAREQADVACQPPDARVVGDGEQVDLLRFEQFHALTSASRRWQYGGIDRVWQHDLSAEGIHDAIGAIGQTQVIVEQSPHREPPVFLAVHAAGQPRGIVAKQGVECIASRNGLLDQVMVEEDFQGVLGPGGRPAA